MADVAMDTSGEETYVSEFDTEGAESGAPAETTPGTVPDSGIPAAPDTSLKPSGGEGEGEVLDPVAALEKLLQEDEAPAPGKQDPKETHEAELQKLLGGMQPGTEAYKRIQTLANARREAMEAVQERDVQLQRTSAYVEELRAAATREIQQQEAQIGDLRNQLSVLAAQVQQFAKPKEPTSEAEQLKQKWLSELKETLSGEFKTRDETIASLKQVMEERDRQEKLHKDSEEFISGARAAAEKIVLRGIQGKEAKEAVVRITPFILAQQMHTGEPVEKVAQEIRKTLLQTALMFTRATTAGATKAMKRSAEGSTVTTTRRSAGAGEGIPSLDKIREMLGDPTANEIDWVTRQELAAR